MLLLIGQAHLSAYLLINFALYYLYWFLAEDLVRVRARWQTLSKFVFSVSWLGVQQIFCGRCLCCAPRLLPRLHCRSLQAPAHTVAISNLPRQLRDAGWFVSSSRVVPCMPRLEFELTACAH